MACFWSLPEAVRAREVANETPAGHLKWARRSRVQTMRSASDTSAPGRRTTTAYGDSPHSADATPITATSATAATARILPPGEKGELAVRADIMFNGYLGDEAKTAGSFGRVLFADALPRNASMKVRKDQLRADQTRRALDGTRRRRLEVTTTKKAMGLRKLGLGSAREP